MFNQLIAISVEATNNSMDLITAVDGFYNSAWNKLIIVGSVSLAIIGLIVPVGVQWYQKKTLKIREEELKKELEGKVAEAKAEIIEQTNKEIQLLIEKFETNIGYLNASATSKTFHIQANTQLFAKQYAEALADYIVAAQQYLICRDYGNIQTVLRLISDDCIPYLSKEEIKDIAIGKNADIETLIVELTQNDNGFFTQKIQEIKLKISKLREFKK